MVSNLVSYQRILEVARQQGKPQKFITELEQLETAVRIDKEQRKRQPRDPAPAGGISLSAGSRKYHIAQPTICRWAKAQYVPVLKDGWEVFIDESRLAQLAAAYHSDPGRGTWAVKHLIQEEQKKTH